MSVRRLDPVQPSSFTFTAENMTWAKKTIAQYPVGKQASAIIALLWRAQEQNAGWLSKPAMEYVGSMLDMAFIRVYEVATFLHDVPAVPSGQKSPCAGVRHNAVHAAWVGRFDEGVQKQNPP